MRCVPAAFFCFLCLFVSSAVAQQLPPPTVGAVTINSPTQSGGEPWRTNKTVIPLQFTSDATNGRFVASSIGGDITFSTFLATGGAGQVAVGFNQEGPHNVQVVVASVNMGPSGANVSSASAGVNIIYDKTPPTLSITQIQVNELQGFIPFSPSQTYYTNANAVIFRGTAQDQYTPRDQIVIKATGAVTGETQVDANGTFEISVDISSLADGVINIDLVAQETLSDGTVSEAGRLVRAKLGADQ